ncbi:MAG: hypothetical protein HYY09_02080 [Firmicutes bacterium]|nr:hypothetical protein [Bacillota bacterium]
MAGEMKSNKLLVVLAILALAAAGLALAPLVFADEPAEKGATTPWGMGGGAGMMGGGAGMMGSGAGMMGSGSGSMMQGLDAGQLQQHHDQMAPLMSSQMGLSPEDTEAMLNLCNSHVQGLQDGGDQT